MHYNNIIEITIQNSDTKLKNIYVHNYNNNKNYNVINVNNIINTINKLTNQVETVI